MHDIEPIKCIVFWIVKWCFSVELIHENYGENEERKFPIYIQRTYFISASVCGHLVSLLCTLSTESVPISVVKIKNPISVKGY